MMDGDENETPTNTQNLSTNSGTSKVESFVDEHEAFAASRVSQYVFVPTKDVYFQTLDQHADTLEGDTKAPLVLVGEEGSGKSALLANWVAKRREHKHRDEFLFQHYVGCTTQSLEVSFFWDSMCFINMTST
jgi:chromosomal replication initiation ATPase DnaA